MVVVDASVALEILIRSPAGIALGDRLFDGRARPQAPHLVDIEIAHVLRRYAAGGEATPAVCAPALSLWLALPVARHPHQDLLPRVWSLRGNLTAYDAAYVALAEALDAPLLTRDRRLAAAPGNAARIELV